MKTLLKYLRPYRWLVVLTLVLAGINTIFSLFDPIIFGKLITLANEHQKIKTPPGSFSWHDFLFIKTSIATKAGKLQTLYGVVWLLIASISVAMISRVAKNLQDYFFSVIVQKFGAKIFTDGLQHAMLLPYQEFEDQRSGETLSILSKVRSDTEKFIISFINVLFGMIVGIVFVSIYAVRLHWSIMPIYLVGMLVLALLTSLLSKKIKLIQKNIVKETTVLAGSTTESLRNIELVKSLGLTTQEIDRLNKNTYKILGLELRKVKSIRTLSSLQGTFVNFLR